MRLRADFHDRSRPSKNSYYSSITLDFCVWGSNCVTTLWSRGRFKGRSRYERFQYSVRSNYARENMSSKTFARTQSRVPLKELSRLKLRRLSGSNTFQNIKIARSLPKFLILPIELMFFVMLSNAFRKCTCKHESKRKSYKSSGEIGNHRIN